MKQTVLKQTCFLLMCIFFSTLLYAQAPQAFSYQSVIRNTEGKPLPQKDIGMQVSIYRETPTGPLTYKETFEPTTNDFGVIEVKIGRGNVKFGNFSQIQWGSNIYFLEIALDANGGSDYQVISRTQMLSVPYALYAENSNENDGDPENELQVLSLSGNILTLSSGGGSVVLPNTGVLTYTGGTGIQITGTIISNTGDTDPFNDITNTTTAGGDLTGIFPNPQIAANAIGSNEIADGSITLNDISTGVVPQNLSDLNDVNISAISTGQVLKWNGTTWVNATDNTGTGGNSYTAGAGIQINGTIISATDNSITNEIQTLMYDSTTQNITILGANTVKLGNLGTSLWKNTAGTLEPKVATNSVYIPSGNLRGGQTNGWKFLNNDGGSLDIYNQSNTSVARLYNNNGSGAFLLSKQNGNPLVTAGKTVENMGIVNVINTNGVVSGSLLSCEHGVGELVLRSPSNKTVIDMGHQYSPEFLNSANGVISVFNASSETMPAAGFYTTDTTSNVFAGRLSTNDIIEFNKSTGLWHTTIWNDEHGGYQMIRNSIGDPRIQLYVDANDMGTVAAGVLTASIKNFRMTHPEHPELDIYYACIEGPEAAAYERGTTNLVNGEAFVPYSNTFGLVINPETVTVQVTSQSEDTYGLCVVEKLPTGFRVKELKGGKGNFAFDWEAKGVRKGYENYKVVRPKEPINDRKNEQNFQKTGPIPH